MFRMVDQSRMNLLFFFGVLIPALVTIGLFVTFCYCWYKMRIRNQILYKKHDPHKIEQLKMEGKNYDPPFPPSPPFKSKMFFHESLSHNNNNVNKQKANDDYEDSPEPTDCLEDTTIYRTNNDSGFSDLNQIQCNVDKSSVNVARNNSDLRPNSQASEDSDDSGFRSSRSGRYLHSASSSTGNAQDSCMQHCLHTVQVHDCIPLFQPVKIHPNENRRKQIVPHIHRNSSRHKIIGTRNVIPTSQHYRNRPTESHCNDISRINAVTSSHQQMSPVQATYMGHSSGQSCNSTQYVSKSINDVNGGRLHSIDSHIGPLSSAGYFGIQSCNDNCNKPGDNSHINRYHGDRLFSQPHSIGYSSDINSIGNMNSYGNGVHDNGHIKTDMLYPISYNNQTSVNSNVPIKSHIPGYNISSATHMKPIQPDMSLYRLGGAIQTIAVPSQHLTVTQAMVHKSYIDELSDPSLFSVV